jgi:hypothetical protein
MQFSAVNHSAVIPRSFKVVQNPIETRCRIESYRPTKFINEILAAAIEGFEAQKRRLDTQIAELRQLLCGDSVEPAATPEPMRKRRKMSAAARQQMADAQRKR